MSSEGGGLACWNEDGRALWLSHWWWILLFSHRHSDWPTGGDLKQWSLEKQVRVVSRMQEGEPKNARVRGGKAKEVWTHSVP